MAGFTKLFSSIVTSSIWVEDDKVLRVWIAMLSQCDAKGKVEGSIPGFASLCRMGRDEMERILILLSSPDPDSRTKEFDGRRILPIPGGWQVLNYLSYREKGQEKEGSRAPYMRARRNETKCNGLHPNVTGDTEGEGEVEVKEEKDKPVPEGPIPSPFRAKKVHGTVLGNYPQELEEAYTVWRSLKKEMEQYSDKFKIEARCFANGCGSKERAWTIWQKLTSNQIAGYGFVTNGQILKVITNVAKSKVLKAKNGVELNYPMLSTMLNKPDLIDFIIHEVKEETNDTK